MQFNNKNHFPCLFQGLSTERYKKVMGVVEKAILSTDMALYFRKKDQFLETANSGEIDWQDDKKDRELFYDLCNFVTLAFYDSCRFVMTFPVLCGMLMTACDVSAISKPGEIQHKMAKRVADEFFDQGDMEKLRLNIQPIVSFRFPSFRHGSRRWD